MVAAVGFVILPILLLIGLDAVFERRGAFLGTEDRIRWGRRRIDRTGQAVCPRLRRSDEVVR